MIDQTIAQMERRIQAAESINPEQREVLLELLSTLRAEVSDLSQTHADQAQSIASFAQSSTHEITREQKDENLSSLSLKGLEASVAGFEESHPRLVDVVNRICTTLSNLGI